MGIAGGPNLNQDGLVFLYDVFDQDNSYKGEPTTNLANTDYLRTIQFHNQGGYNNAGSILDAPEKGLGWKKIIITDRGNNFRIAQFPYIVQNYGETRVYSVEYDFTSTSGYFIYGDGSSGFGGGADNGTRVYCTFTPPSVNNWHEALFIGNNTPASGINDVIYYRNYQVEVNTHPTQFTTGTRSATQGLLDVVGTTQIDLTNVSFDANAQITFDGSNDYINIGSGTGINQFSGDFTISLWAMRTAGGNYGNLIGDYYTNSTGTTGEWQIMMGPSSQLNLYKVGSGYIISNIASGFSNNTWINVVVTRLGNLVTMYANSNVIATGSDSTSYGTVTGNLNIGIDGNNSSEPFPGNIASISIYKNRALSAQEVLQNYNATKSRFSLK